MKHRILVVEDEVQIARMLKIELELEGYEVLIEHNGKSVKKAKTTRNVDLAYG
ncbi:hypothetical protein [Fictibacillus sp. KU28468]|uniref:hypothetical protein n=1 Tax=Fictibacillus sp. KU28468 TaxID=2991053 RepID=UPI002AC8713C|nr:hypothetical protein [Fictibacillus sp. KU28468]